MRYTILILILISGCGQLPNGQQHRPPDSACLIKDQCTYADVLDYYCEVLRWEPDFGSGDKITEHDYQGHPCIITKQDMQRDPNCDPQNPNKMCGGGWGGDPEIKCCAIIQGPGAPVSP